MADLEVHVMDALERSQALRDAARTDDPPTYAHRREVEKLKEELTFAQSKLRITEESLSNARGRATAHAQELIAFKAHATEVLHREADEREFCTDFDDVMEEIGLRRRKRDATVSLTVTLNVDLDTCVSGEEGAETEIERDEIAAAICSSISAHNIEEFTVESVDWS